MSFAFDLVVPVAAVAGAGIATSFGYLIQRLLKKREEGALNRMMRRSLKLIDMLEVAAVADPEEAAKHNLDPEKIAETRRSIEALLAENEADIQRLKETGDAATEKFEAWRRGSR